MKLRDYLKTYNIRKRSFSKKLGISRVTLNKYLFKPSTTPLTTKLAVEYLTNKRVTLTDWEYEEEKIGRWHPDSFSKGQI